MVVHVRGELCGAPAGRPLRLRPVTARAAAPSELTAANSPAVAAGKIIGKGGESINVLQARSGAEAPALPRAPLRPVASPPAP